jgi:uncharacterized surface protein with fasciclin (FAS1) repeats
LDLFSLQEDREKQADDPQVRATSVHGWNLEELFLWSSHFPASQGIDSRLAIGEALRIMQLFTSSLGRTLPTLILLITSLMATQGLRADHHEEKDIVGLASENESLKTLVKALKSAGLTDILKLKGPFTVLAPTDEAFSKLPEGTLEGLLQPENRQKLAILLKNHVITAQLKSDDLKPGTRKSIAGKELTITHQTSDDTKDSNLIKINSATVLKADLMTSNGVIHLIDTVLIPKP